MDLGIIQITNFHTKREEILINEIIPHCVKISNGKYTLVSPENKRLQAAIEKIGGEFSLFTSWDKDMSRKWRQGIRRRPEEWVAFFADDILPDDKWYEKMEKYLENRAPGQYGFRLTDELDHRHEFGEDWMQFPSNRYRLPHRPLKYDVNSGYIEDSPTAYVANCVVHRDVLAMVEPFGLYKASPDVMWCLAVREYGFPIGFNVGARAYHLGDREDNR